MNVMVRMPAVRARVCRRAASPALSTASSAWLAPSSASWCLPLPDASAGDGDLGGAEVAEVVSPLLPRGAPGHRSRHVSTLTDVSDIPGRVAAAAALAKTPSKLRSSWAHDVKTAYVPVRYTPAVASAEADEAEDRLSAESNDASAASEPDGVNEIGRGPEVGDVGAAAAAAATDLAAIDADEAPKRDGRALWNRNDHDAVNSWSPSGEMFTCRLSTS